MTEADDFLATATRLGLVPEGDEAALRQECAQSGLDPRQFLVDQRRLDAVDVDIVETLLAPEVLVPGYRVLGLLGRGGMGVVYRALQQNLNRTVALKTILFSRMTDSTILDRFELEAQTIGKLRHPNILAAHDFGRASGRLYLAMELVEGVDLEHRIASSGPLGEFLAWGFARQAASGLAHAARHNIVHRDLKPANLVLVEPPEGYPLPAGMPMVKIADFGLALLTADAAVETRLTADRTTLGSPHYMAPEQLESSSVDLRADIYALGATVYHALAGQAPFSGLKLPQLIAAKLHGGPLPLIEVAPRLQPATCRLVERMMARAPQDRPASYTELLAEIDQLDHSSDEASRHTTIIVTAADPVAKTAIIARSRQKIARRWLRGVAAVVAVLLLAFAYYHSRSLGTVPASPVATRDVGYSKQLFNGETLEGWTRRSGGWSVPRDSALLAGTNGVAERLLFLRGDDGSSNPATARPLEWYRLELQLHPPQAEGRQTPPAQEVHFGLVTASERDGTRYVLRATDESLSVGRRDSDQGDFVPDSRFPAARRRQDRPVVVAIQRLPNGWFLAIDDRPLASLPLHPGGELPEFRLAVDGGTAQFSDVTVTELQPVAP